MEKLGFSVVSCADVGLFDAYDYSHSVCLVKDKVASEHKIKQTAYDYKKLIIRDLGQDFVNAE